MQVSLTNTVVHSKDAPIVDAFVSYLKSTPATYFPFLLFATYSFMAFATFFLGALAEPAVTAA